MAGLMMHHRTTAQNFAFSPKKPSGNILPQQSSKPISLQNMPSLKSFYL
jgi:hypothetical protein